MIMDPALLRAFERILAVAIGGMSILLGYKLFLALPQQRSSSGEVKLPWNIAIILTRVGPGVFFALFGAAVVALGLHEGVSTTSDRTTAPTGEQTEIVSTNGVAQGTSESTETLSVRRLRAAERIQFLNSLQLRTDLSEDEKRSAAEEIASIKLALMQSVWAADWGDGASFQIWVEDGAVDPVPGSLRQPAAFFRARPGGAP